MLGEVSSPNLKLALLLLNPKQSQTHLSLGSFYGNFLPLGSWLLLWKCCMRMWQFRFLSLVQIHSKVKSGFYISLDAVYIAKFMYLIRREIGFSFLLLCFPLYLFQFSFYEDKSNFQGIC